MTSRLQNEIHQQKPFRGPETEAYLEIVRTAGVLVRNLEQLLKQHGLTATQYNVLRILRGAGERGLTCSEISDRMVTADPDVTRLLDRMEKRGLLSRSRGAADRRVVTTTITPEGLRLVAELDAPIEDLHRQQFKSLTKPKLRELIGQLDRIRAALESPR